MKHDIVWSKDGNDNIIAVSKCGKLWLTGTKDFIKSIQFVWKKRPNGRFHHLPVNVSSKTK